MSEPLPEGSVAAPEEMTEIRQPKLSKVEEKRQQIFRDRVRRKMGDGMSEEKAVQSVMREDYEAMPLDKKFARLETAVANAVNGLMHNVNTIRQNEHVVADAFDVNYRAIQKMFARLGLDEKAQNECIDEARRDVNEERLKEIEQREKARAEAAVKSEQEVVSQELNKVEQKPIQTAAESDERPTGVDPHVESGATEFGG